MFCKYCGRPLDEDGFCSSCGIVFESESGSSAPPAMSGMAVAGFVIGVVSLFTGSTSLGYIAEILGLVFSCIGISDTKRGKKRGRGLAVVGLLIQIIPFIYGFICGLNGLPA